ncbi:MAG: hypothetical protein EB059_05680 [Alphaproteobacteria bacterium]|nr:hypothetical protein [Alphaproteobacteria bacterium]
MSNQHTEKPEKPSQPQRTVSNPLKKPSAIKPPPPPSRITMDEGIRPRDARPCDFTQQKKH